MDDLPTGLDLSSLIPPTSGAQAPQRVSPGMLRQPQKPGGLLSGFAQASPLMMLLPIIMKTSGPAGMAAFLQGMDQARQQKQQGQQQQFQNTRLMQGDERQAAQDQATADYRKQQLQDAFRQRVLSAAGNIETPEGAKALLDFMGGEGQSIGIPRSAVEAYVMETATPAKLIEKQVRKVVSKASPELLQAWHDNHGSLMVNGKPVPYEVWSQFATDAVDAQGRPIVKAPPPPKPDAPNSPEEYFYQTFAKERGAKSFGELPTSLQLAARRQWGTAVPPASVMYPQPPTPIPDVLEGRPDPATANKPDLKTGLTPNAVFQNGATWALTGRMPSMGMGSRGQVIAARSAIQNTGAALAARAGVDLPTLQAEYRANAGTLSKLLPIATATAGASATANDNLQLALEQSPTVARTGSRLVNRYAQWFQGNLTPAAGLSQFELYIYTAAREYAKVTSGGAASTAGLTVSAAKEADALINAAQSPEAFAAVVQGMQNDMANVVKNQQKQLAGVSSTIANFFGAVNGVGPVDSGGPAATTPPPGESRYQRYLRLQGGKK